MPTNNERRTGVTVYRELTFDRAAVNTEARTCELAFASEEPVQRGNWREVISLAPGAVRLDRLRSGGALLLNHDPEHQIGVVESVEVGPDRKARAVVRFSRSALGSEIMQDVGDGIRRNVSVGYVIHDMQLQSRDDGGETYLATDWEPLEISIVSVPADTTVGVGRAAPEPSAPTPHRESITMPDTNTAPAPDLNQERARVAEILAMGESHKMQAEARKAIADGTDLNAFRAAVLAEVSKRTQQAPESASAAIGMTDKEVRQYSLRRAIAALIPNSGVDAGYERELSDEIAKRSGTKPRGIYVPWDVQARAIVSKRALTAGSVVAGGAFVGSDAQGQTMIELLRNREVTSAAGATMLSGLQGNLPIPKITGAGTAYWGAENPGADTTSSTQATGLLNLTPHELRAITAFSKQLLAQSSVDVEMMVRDDLVRVLALAKDLAALHGTGAAGQPLGISATTGINTVTFGAAATWAKVLDFETQVAVDNADVDAMTWATTPAVRAKLKAAVAFSNTASPIWAPDNTVNGYRALVSNQVAGNVVIFGNWRDLIVADWGTLDITVDPYTLAGQGMIRVIAGLLCDVGLRHEVSFCVSTDSGAQ